MCGISSKRRIRWVAGLLLLAYGSAGVLGNGLHELWGCSHLGHDHVHADGLVHSHSHAHGHGCHHHHEELPTHETSEGQPSELVATEDCAICQFLAQAQSPTILEFGTCCLGAASLIDQSVDHSYCDPFCGIGSARAPPLG